MYRKGSYIAARIIGLAAVLVLGALFAIQTPSVQTRLSRYAMDRLTAAADGRILYDEIKVIPSGALVVKNILILDKILTRKMSTSADGPPPTPSSKPGPSRPRSPFRASSDRAAYASGE